MSVTTNSTRTATGTPRRRVHRHSHRTPMTRLTRSRRSVQPLHEALAVGLGCTATGYRLGALPEWR